MDELEQELKEDFLQEATQLLEDSEQAFLTLENDPKNEDLLNQIFRLAHNLKGTSRAVGFGGVAEFTHEFENLILKIKEGTLEPSDNVITLLLEGNDHLVIMIKMLKMDIDSQIDSTELIEKIQEILANISNKKNKEKGKISKNDPTVELDLNPVKTSTDVLEKDSPIQERQDFETNTSSDNSNIDSLLNQAPPSEVKFFVGNQETTKSLEKNKTDKAPNKIASVKKDESIRVSLLRVEELNNFVGELVILQTVLQQRGELLVKDELMLKSLRQLGKLSKEIQEISMRLRMVPLKTTMQKMGRIVRDTSKVLNKKVNLILEGEDTEIDKTVLEYLSDPLVHIIRNAVDHGLGTPEERKSVQKEEEGSLILKASHEGNNLVIKISDDGKGIDPSIIRNKAVSKGIIKKDSQHSDQELINLIFHAGFSTKEEVSEVSGRGVGMDVVKTNIENLSGVIKIDSVVGKGSIFTVRLPLTLAIIEGMIVKSDNEKFIIPISQITESLRPHESDIHFITGVGECIDLRGEVIPVFDLQSAFIATPQKINYKKKTAVVVRNENIRFAVMVDDIINQQQVVIKKIGREIINQQGFMGSAILGDGKPAIIIDLIELFGTNAKMKQKKDYDLQGNV